MRALEPRQSGSVTCAGVRIAYEVFGGGDRTVVFLPTWSIVHARHWKAQVPFFARHARVVTFDGPGNGGSDRSTDPRAYDVDAYVGYAIAVLDATGTAKASIVTLSMGAQWGVRLAQLHPDRVEAVAFIAPTIPLAGGSPGRVVAMASFDAQKPSYTGWHKYNRNYWLSDFADFAAFFFGEALAEPHSTKQHEDCVAWSFETTPEVLVQTQYGATLDEDEARAAAQDVRCPVLVIHGDRDRVSPHARGAALAEATGGTLLTMEGSGHFPHARDPVAVNLAVRRFLGLDPKPETFRRARARPKRALYLSSPIGLGHAQRDVAIARELRALHPGLEIDWLAQHPVTTVLEANGERVHPASALLASESAHVEHESGEHDVQCFEAIRRMDEILVANFLVFRDAAVSGQYDLWIADEAWDVDYFLHENPDQKRAPYVWMTDFVGYLPMPDNGEREARLTADYNAEMIEQIDRYPKLRDRSIFVGNPEDIVPDAFGADLPAIREWTERHFDFAGYVTGFDPAALADRDALRARFGYRADETICIVTVGGSGVGVPLLRRIIAAHPYAAAAIPKLRTIVVAGPRIDASSLPRADGVEVVAYVPNLYERLAACDIALVQGGLTTTMELAANGRPFLYFPLRHHFEQNFHVRHRLDRYGAGRCMDYHGADPRSIATAMLEELARPVRARPVESGGAARAAAMIAALL